MIDWLHSDLALRLGYTLLHSLWQGAAIGATAILILRLMRRSTAAARYTLAAFAMLLMVAAPAATFFALRTPHPDAPAPLFTPLKTPLSTTTPPRAAASPTGAISSALPPQPDDPALADVLPPHAAVRPSPRAWLEAHLPYATAAWTLGVLLLSLWHLGGWIALQRLRIIGIRPIPAHIQALLTRLARLLAIRHRVRIAGSLRVDVPILLGLFKPLILIPSAMLSGLTPGQLEAILAHELAHIRRYDYLALLLQTAAETLLFYHPAVWWLSRRLRLEREQCCDDLAITIHGDRRQYAGALAAIEALRLNAPQPILAATGASAHELMLRIARLLGLEAPRPPRRTRIAAGTLLIALSVLAALTLPLLAQSTKPSYTLSKQTTAITSPLLPDGRPDYAGALNEQMGKGVTPDNNGYVLWLQVFGSDTIPALQRDEVLKLCGARPTGAGDPPFVYYGDFLKRKNGTDPDASVAAEIATAAHESWKPTQHPDLAAYVDAQQKPLDLLVETAERPQWWNPIVYDKMGEVSTLSYPHFAGASQALRTLAARATLRAGIGDFNGFLRDALAIKRLGHRVHNGGQIICQQVAMFFDQTANEAIAAVVESGDLSAQQLALLQQAVTDIGPLPPRVDATLNHYERYEALLEFPQCIAKERLDNADRGLFTKLATQGADIDSSAIDVDAALITINTYFDDLIGTLQAHSIPDMKNRFRDIQVRVNGWKADAEGAPTGVKPAPGESHAAYTQRIAHWYVTFWQQPFLMGVAEPERQEILQHEMLITLIAAARAKAADGNWPDRLEALVPSLLRELPIDPYSADGQSPVQYRLENGHPVIFCIGAGPDASRLRIGPTTATPTATTATATTLPAPTAAHEPAPATGPTIVTQIESGPAPQGPSAKPAFTISKETTAITTPLLPDGRPDYAGAINAQLNQGVTPDNNGYVLWLRVAGTESLHPGSGAKLLELCGAPDTGPGRFVAFSTFLADHNADPALASIYTTAGRELWKPADHPELADYLDAQRPSLDLMVQAAERPHWWIPCVPESTDDNITTLSVPPLAGVSAMAHTLAARATLRAATGDFEGFRRDTLAIKRLARHLADSGTIITTLLAEVFDQTANQAITAAAGSLTAPQAAQLQQDLAALPPLPSAIASSMDRRQRYAALLEFPQVIGRTFGPSDADPIRAAQIAAIDTHSFDLDAALITINSRFDDLTAGINTPGITALKDRLNAQQVTEDGWKAAVDGDGAKPLPGESRTAYAQRIARWFLTIADNPSRLAGLEESRRQFILQDEMLITLLAAARSRATTGAWPDRLESLIPTYLKAIPLDPYSADEKSPIQYRLENGQPLIFSIGAGPDPSRLRIGTTPATAPTTK